MAVLIVLFASWLVFRGIGALGVPALAIWHDSARHALAVMFVFTGIAHFNKMKYDLVRMGVFPECTWACDPPEEMKDLGAPS